MKARTGLSSTGRRLTMSMSVVIAYHHLIAQHIICTIILIAENTTIAYNNSIQHNMYGRPQYVWQWHRGVINAAAVHCHVRASTIRLNHNTSQTRYVCARAQPKQGHRGVVNAAAAPCCVIVSEAY